MPTITDVEAIIFSNNKVRTGADVLATLYYECKHLKNVKDSDANTATTIAIREGQIRSVSSLMLSAVLLLPASENIWFNVGAGSALNIKITNDAGDDMGDGSPQDGRPPINGQDVHNLMSRIIDLDDWILDAAFGGPGTGTSRTAMLNTILVCGKDGNNPLIVSQVNTFIDNRCGEIITEYEAGSNVKLNHLLAAAPNPRNPA